MFKKFYDAVLLYAPYVMGLGVIATATLGVVGLFILVLNWVFKLLGV